MTARATTVEAVDAELLTEADMRGISDECQVYYLLGMCKSKLASANREIERLTKLNAAMQDELDEVQS